MAAPSINPGSRFCLFCYKSIELSENNESSKIVQAFTNLLNRYARNHKAKILIVQDDLSEKLKVFDNLLNCCLECQNIIEEFCLKYQQLKILEMELDWKLVMLVSEINHANKVPTRWKHVKKVLEFAFQNDLDKRTGSENTVRKLRQCVVNAGK